MKSMILAIFLGLPLGGYCHAIETGEWKGANGDLHGIIQVRERGQGYAATLYICKPAGQGDACYCLQDKETREVNEGLQVLHKGEPGFVIHQAGNGIRLIPAPDTGPLPVCGRPINFGADKIAGMKWKKVR